mmetsp:Transcript_27728/g.46426  ORF Transcript_27728/g.46426 Transcript_27728/m.46426 type:complete len:122 (+) Transcript_27728:151-516(+)|eukprot:CAMPEP_0198230024 /NCGR_PEP_ID=MMETSP1445-20131203/114431_1 /TAXON_ID=36898 /ORGANISM="Pyramimonas sp., Strain CCMP2087" /LENGTH=121 /DNA_ID=CAMNT_0043910519 /DNA_START=1187 /DNA_END=1552 /DNA_ORIENTATION=-
MGKNRPDPALTKKGDADDKGKEDEREKGVDSMEVRHILVEKMGKSEDILKIIESGKMTFNEAAREFSIDKAGRSGLLGWKRKTELDPDFWEAALKVKVGEYTKEPVKTQYGYHIIMVQSRK